MKSKYKLAILLDSEEVSPPSNDQAIKKFVSAGTSLGLVVEIISKRDINRLSQFDALFIRETTSITNHTLEFSVRAEQEGLIVIDDSSSIIACTDKAYQYEIFSNFNVPTPKTLVIYESNINEALATFNLPFVLKLPDSAYSLGVVKVESRDEYYCKVNEFLNKSLHVVAQEYMYSFFDWRIVILNKEVIFACKYYMAKDHWQIINWREDIDSDDCTGYADGVPLSEVPLDVINISLQAADPIGNGLYGVDVKEIEGKCFVIEVNDNPSMDHGVEDLVLGDFLYEIIMQEFLDRIKMKKK